MRSVDGGVSDIYNPWSITMYLDKQEFATYWADTNENGLVGKLVREGSRKTKIEFEKLLNGEYIETEIDEQIIFSQLSEDEDAIWSLLLAFGYLKVVEVIVGEDGTGVEGIRRYRLMLAPKDAGDIAVIMEFKVFDKRRGERDLEDTAQSALRQIEEKKYEADLLKRGIPKERIYKYGIAFEGEKCLIRKALGQRIFPPLFFSMYPTTVFSWYTPRLSSFMVIQSIYQNKF